MSLLRLDIDTSQVQRLSLDLSATEDQAEKALLSTLGKLSKWLTSISVKRLSKHLDIPQHVLRRRIKKFSLRKTGGGGGQVQVFYGLNPVAVIDIDARQTRAGVSAGKRRIKSAFIRRGRGGHVQVFKRRGAARLPIDKQVVDIDEAAQVFIEDHLLGTDEFEAQFFKLFEHELKWRTRTRK